MPKPPEHEASRDARLIRAWLSWMNQTHPYWRGYVNEIESRLERVAALQAIADAAEKVSKNLHRYHDGHGDEYYDLIEAAVQLDAALSRRRESRSDA